MMKFRVLLILILGFQFATAGELFFKSGKETVSNNIETNFELLKQKSAASFFEGKFYTILQFTTIPTEEIKQLLKNNNVELGAYIPNNAYYTVLSSLPKIEILKQAGVSSIVEVLPLWKKDIKLYNKEDYSWAIQNSKIDITITPFSNKSNIELIAFLQSNLNAELLSNTVTESYFSVRIESSLLNAVLNIAAVQFVEPINKPFSLESSSAITNHKSNTLDVSYSTGRHFNGKGVSVSIGDDGKIDSHIDFNGRVINNNTSSNGIHGDHVAGILTGAGNLNPNIKGHATGSELHSFDGWDDITKMPSLLNDKGIVITSHSLSDGCNSGYTSFTNLVDKQVRLYSPLVHIFSAGNSGNDVCGGIIGGWRTITGGNKSGKNVIAVGNIDGSNIISPTSSKGPTFDGRIKPDITAVGTNVISTQPNNTFSLMSGTSMSAPAIAGTMAQLYEMYKSKNNQQNPESGLMKAILLNTADDLGNAGPDFTYGWGKVNARRAANIIEENKYFTSNISDNRTNIHSISIPVNVAKAKIMVYWTDYEGAVSSSKVLVNNIDAKLTSTSQSTFLPWVMDAGSNPTSISCAAIAVKGNDNVNNMEQIEISNPVSGTYTLNVFGASIPQGPQKYWVVCEYIMNEIVVTFPIGGESFAPGSTQRISWDAPSNRSTFAVDYTLNNGLTWNSINAYCNATFVNWTVPSSVSGQVKVRVNAGGLTAESDTVFSILGAPTNVVMNDKCPTVGTISWSFVQGADYYEVFSLGAKYMEIVGTTTKNSFEFSELSSSQTYFYAVRAMKNDGTKGLRSNAILYTHTGNGTCETFDLSINVISSPLNRINANNEEGITIKLLNLGSSTVLTGTVIPFSYKMDNGIIVTNNCTITNNIAFGKELVFTFETKANFSTAKTYKLQVYHSWLVDAKKSNDTLVAFITVNKAISCPILSNLKATNITSKSITLKWNSTESNTTYKVSYSVFGSSESKSVITSRNEALISNLESNVNYTFNVEATCSSNSALTINASTIQENQTKGLSLKAYPNPATEILTIELDALTENTLLEIYSIKGELMMKEYINKNTSSKTLNVAAFLPGIYIIKLRHSNLSENLRFIKSN